MPNDVSGSRHVSRAISSRSTRASSLLKPPPPYSFGHSGTVQPRSAMRSSHTRCASFLNFQRRPPQQTSPSSATGWRISAGQFASSQARVSRRKALELIDGFELCGHVYVPRLMSGCNPTYMLRARQPQAGRGESLRDAAVRECARIGCVALQARARTRPA